MYGFRSNDDVDANTICFMLLNTIVNTIANDVDVVVVIRELRLIEVNTAILPMPI